MATCRSLLPSLVAVLLQHSCPHAIILAVVAVVVFTFNTVSLAWPLPHVLIEAGEIIEPLVANPDSPTAIIGILGMFGICASPSHIYPHGVLRECSHSVRSASPSVVFLGALPAPRGPSCKNWAVPAIPGYPTITATSELGLPSALSSGNRLNNKIAVSLPDHGVVVDYLSHRSNYTLESAA